MDHCLDTKGAALDGPLFGYKDGAFYVALVGAKEGTKEGVLNEALFGPR